MKKFLQIGALSIICVVFLTACGGKTLTCTIEGEEDGMKQTEEIKYTFKDDKVSKAKMTMTMELEDNSQIDTYKEMIEQQYEEINKKDGVKVEVKASGKKLTVTMDVDATKLTKEDLEGEYDDFAGTLDEIKKQYTDNDYKCK